MKHKKTKSNVIERYLYAVDMEYALTCFWGKWAFNFSNRLQQIPQGFTCGKLLLRFSTILNPLMPLFCFGWVIIGMPLYTIIWTVSWLLSGGWNQRTTCPATVYIHASTDRYLSFVPREKGRPSVAIVLPFRKTSTIGSWPDELVDLRAITTRTTIIRAAVLSIRATIRLFFSGQTKKVLFTYTAPNWFWVDDALETVSPTSIWMSNHYDRWAALATSRPNSSVTIVQHGLLRQMDYRTGENVIYKLQSILPNIKRVFVLDEQSIAEFKAAITGEGPEFIKIKSKLNIVPWKRLHPQQLRVFVIGSPRIKNKTILLAQNLLYELPGNVAIAYRPHPCEPQPVIFPEFENNLVKVVPPDDTVPEMDVILDYGSSFAGEIVAATGAKLIGWNGYTSEDIIAVIREIKARQMTLQ